MLYVYSNADNCPKIANEYGHRLMIRYRVAWTAGQLDHDLPNALRRTVSHLIF